VKVSAGGLYLGLVHEILSIGKKPVNLLPALRRGREGCGVNFLQRTGRGGLEDREFSSLCELPEAPKAGIRNIPFTAADEKIPLSVVDVNNKPQYLVFSFHFAHLVRKQRQSPVESSKAP
jgi:hypothetical protein